MTTLDPTHLAGGVTTDSSGGLLEGLDRLLPLVPPGAPARALCQLLGSDRELIPAGGLHASIVVVLADADYRFRVGLAMTKGLRGRPQIVRDGVNPPWMDARSLGMPGDRVTDPLLQRTGSMFFNLKSLVDELELFRRMLKGLAEREPDNTRQRETCEQLCDLLSRQSKLILKASGHEYVAGRVRLLSEECRRRLPESDNETLTRIITGLAGLNEQLDYHVRHLLGAPEIVTDSDYRNVIIQGLGDLSMNPWNVAFFNNGFGGQQEVYAPAAEPLWERTYTCFGEISEPGEAGFEKAGAPANPFASLDPQIGGVLRSSASHVPDLVIGRFTLQPLAPHIRLANQPHTPVQSWLNCAVYGKAVLWNGVVIDPELNIDEWSDYRHVFHLPNLNPAEPASIDDLAAEWKKTGVHSDDAHRFANAWAQRPRLIFGDPQHNDVWLFEQQLLAPGAHNLRRLACRAPILVDLAELHLPRVWIDACLRNARYKRVEDHGAIQLDTGQYRWEEGSRARIEVHLKRNRYPCTIVGIGRIRDDRTASDSVGVVVQPLGPSADLDGNNALFSLAVGGRTFEQSQFTIWDYAELLRTMGCRYALVFDEGQDVFQGVIPTADEAQEIVADREQDETRFMRVPRSPSRNRLRAHLAIRQVRRPN